MKKLSDGTELLTTCEAATYIGQSDSWMAQARRFNTGPNIVRLGDGKGRVWYTRADLNTWLAQQGQAA